MKTQYQQLRNILDAVVYPIDPAHEAAFKAMLAEDKKRRRKNLLLFLFSFAVLFAAGYLALSSLLQAPVREVPVEVQPTEPTATAESTTSSTVPLSVSGNASDNISNSSSQLFVGPASSANAAVSQNAPESQKNTSGSNAPLATNQMNTSESSAVNPGNSANAASPSSGHRKELASSKGTQKILPNQSVTSAAKNEAQETPAVAMDTNKEVTGNQEVKTTPDMITDPQESLADAVTENKEANTVHSTNANDAHTVSGTQALQSDPSELAYNTEVASKEIIPALRKVQSRKLHYGVTGALFPTGQLLSKSSVKTGYGFNVGGYANYQIKPRTLLRADAGFSHIDGGFAYTKQSESEQFGFFAVHSTNTLSVDRLYAGYLSAEVGLQRGKKMFCAGVHGQYLYGARGDILIIQHASIEQSPVITESNNVWIETKDMDRFSLHALAGMRAKMSRRVELALFLRIPVTHTLKKQTDISGYQFDIQSHGITPHFTLSYQINQQ